MVELRDFNDTEIAELHQYISTNTPYSVLQTIYPVTENPNKKTQVYTIMYRLINGCKNYVKDITTKNKVEELLKESEDIYLELYSINLKIVNTTSFGTRRLNKKIENVLSNLDNLKKINKLIDAFLIFSEKQTFYETDRVTGVIMETPEGAELVKKILE